MSFADWVEKFKDYWRENTLAQSDGDTGDSSQRIGTFWALIGLQNLAVSMNFYVDTVKAHEIYPGRYMRSPVKGYWGNDPTNFSRDQHSILMIAFAVMGDKLRLKKSMLEIFKRAGFHQNFLRGTDDIPRKWKCPDFLTPFELTVAIRGLGLWYLYPVLLVLDLAFFLDFWFRKLHVWDYDNMMATNLFYASKVLPTPWSRISFHAYELTDFKQRIHHYHTSSNGIKPLYDLFISTYDHLRGKYAENFIDRLLIRFFKLWNKTDRSGKL
ncbi:MAG: hypothetical protein BWZ03_00147 [bacterium ADurb.BinA186]|nr:MAG: hypothetical protein BWZ03_00147 [bacterium ADurb.BinA186]